MATFEFSELKPNSGLKDELFDFKAPADVEIVRAPVLSRPGNRNGEKALFSSRQLRFSASLDGLFDHSCKNGFLVAREHMSP